MFLPIKTSLKKSLISPFSVQDRNLVPTILRWLNSLLVALQSWEGHYFNH